MTAPYRRSGVALLARALYFMYSPSDRRLRRSRAVDGQTWSVGSCLTDTR